MLPLSASVLSLCLASQEVAIEPYCLANANTLCSCPMHCIAILFHCLCIVRARKLSTRLLRRNKELIMHFKAETMMTLRCASWTQLHRARHLISCPGQLNRWRCQWVSQWVSESSFDFSHFSDTAMTLQWQWHFSDTTVTLQWHYSDTSGALQWHYSDTTVTLQWH